MTPTSFAEGAYLAIGDGSRPGPVVEARISSPNTPSLVARIELKIDTGADVTLLPASIRGAVSPTVVAQQTVTGFDGSTGNYDVVEVRFEVGNVAVPSVKVCVGPGSYGLLGRDLLDLVILELNGPAQRWRLLR